MQRKPGFPAVSCSIKMPDGAPPPEPAHEEDSEQRRQQLFNFGHSQWGCNNWNWSVTKQDLDFVDFENGKYTVGVAAFVAVVVKSHGIHRENVGYATCAAATKGLAIYMARRCAVTNSLRETLLSFGGGVAAQLGLVLDAPRGERAARPPAHDARPHAQDAPPDAHQCQPDNPAENGSLSDVNIPRDSVDANGATPNIQPAPAAPPPAKNVTFATPPVAKTHTVPAGGRAPVHRGHHNDTAPATALPAPQPPEVAEKPQEVPARPPEAPSAEELRAERKRRQRQAQEEFRQKQMKHRPEHDEKQDLQKSSTSFDELLLDINSQDIVLDEDEDGADTETGKRKSPVVIGSIAKRRSSRLRLDIFTD